MKNLKVVFMGTPEFAVPVLKTLIENIDTNAESIEVYKGTKKIANDEIVANGIVNFGQIGNYDFLAFLFLDTFCYLFN